MDSKQRTKISKFFSRVLRHAPTSIGITLDAQGWVAIDTLLAAASRHGQSVPRTVLDEIVQTNEKQRFAISEDGKRVRANQGHSVEVDLAYEPAAEGDVPYELFHGTIPAAIAAIRSAGLSKMSRHHVHLSADVATAQIVGGRRGRAVVLRVKARAMVAAGHVFYRSANGVWLTDSVPPAFIDWP